MHIWKAALQKWAFRARAIAAARPPPQLAVLMYDQRCVSVLAYLSQLAEPPPLDTRIELHMLHRILALPPNTFTLAALAHWQEYGLVRFALALPQAIAASARYATFTWQGWRDCARELRAATLTDEATLAAPTHACCSPPWWDTPPIALRLEAAATGSLALASQAETPWVRHAGELASGFGPDQKKHSQR